MSPAGVPAALWANGPNDVWATFGNALHRFDGSTWNAVNPPPLQHVFALWASGPNDVWVGGADETGHGAVVRWNGSAYVSAPLPAGRGAIDAITGRSATDVWLAMGNESQHWNGTEFETSTFVGKFFYGGGLWLPSTGGPWAFGLGYSEPRLQRWDGTAWVALPPVLDEFFHDAWGSAWNDVWAVGEDGIAHFDGVKWSPMPLAAGSKMRAIWGASASEVYAVGLSDLHRWDGTSWSIVASEPATEQAALVDVWGTGPSDVWIATKSGVRHWDGSSLTPLPGGPPAEPTAIWASSASDVWITLAGGIARFDGTTWETQELPGSFIEHVLFTIWGRGPNDVWAGGYQATFHFDGTTWSKLDDTVTGASAIWGCGDDTVALLDNDELALFTGGAFDVFPLPGSGNNALWGPSSDHLLVFGAGSGIRRRVK